ncbi:3-methyladenine DNA glycosylase [Actinopolymorpha sp. NPDC004070]|uniref:3-methyladenine DNA glycosylase n=1 Tax=Actinopolymorpha sp. NPDC004070 TaxID=3154548 RepID=UPI0033B73999
MSAPSPTRPGAPAGPVPAGPAVPDGRVLSEQEWPARRDAHETRVDAWLRPHLHRRGERRAHPVEDFLFTYYSHRPARLRRWHPGAGVVLAGDAARAAYGDSRDYTTVPGGVTVDPAALAARVGTVRWIRDLLAATRARPAFLGCFGLHEWAMVYRQPPEEVRHAGWPLRLGADGTDQVVESHRIRCSHFDAYRFFTGPARPRNTLSPARETQRDLEQPGCLHANMDLYKWAYKLSPHLRSELVADCFELAREIRELDMRASPYDLSALGYRPVPIETPEGRAEYAAAQRGFAERAGILRDELVRACDDLLALAGQDAS